MKIFNVCEGSWTSNCYVLISEGHALVIDPSASAKAILELVKQENASLEGILLTHGHFDHILSLDTLRERTGVPAYIHTEDAIMLTDGKKNAFFEFFGKERTYGAAEKLMSDGDRIPIGNETLTVYHTPGHTHGSVCFISGRIIFSGDTIFADTYGRYDLWNGNLEKLRESMTKLSKLDPTLTVYPGHGTTAPLGVALNSFYI